eukprot:1393422-Rhodomonas_salina.1
MRQRRRQRGREQTARQPGSQPERQEQTDSQTERGSRGGAEHRAYSGRALGVAVRPLLVRDHVILRVALRLLRGVAVLVELGRGAQDPVDQLQETHDVDNLVPTTPVTPRQKIARATTERNTSKLGCQSSG